MRNAILLSTGLHLGFLLVVLIGLPELFKPDPLLDRIVPVQVVVQQPKDEPKKEEPKKPEPKKEEPPPPPQQAALPEPPEPEVEKIPEPKPKIPEPKPEKKAEPKPKPKPKLKLKPKPKVAKAEPKPPPKPKPKVEAKAKPKPDDFQSLLKNLAAQSQQNRNTKPPEPQERKVADASNARIQMSGVEMRRVQNELAELVKRQITPCWNIPVGAKDVQQMQIGIRIFLNPDGSLRGTPRIEDAGRMRRDTTFQVLAESAVRALQNPRCSPLKLPHDKYDIWQEISFNFDPREAL